MLPNHKRDHHLHRAFIVPTLRQTTPNALIVFHFSLSIVIEDSVESMKKRLLCFVPTEKKSKNKRHQTYSANSCKHPLSCSKKNNTTLKLSRYKKSRTDRNMKKLVRARIHKWPLYDLITLVPAIA